MLQNLKILTVLKYKDPTMNEIQTENFITVQRATCIERLQKGATKHKQLRTIALNLFG